MCVYIYRDVLKCVMTHQFFVCHALYLQFENSNDRSKPFKMFFIFKSPCIPNFTFFRNFLLFYRMDERCINPMIAGTSYLLIFHPSDKIVKNFEKNVKFDLHGDFIMKNKLNGSDRSFELSNWRY